MKSTVRHTFHGYRVVLQEINPHNCLRHVLEVQDGKDALGIDRWATVFVSEANGTKVVESVKFHGNEAQSKFLERRTEASPREERYVQLLVAHLLNEIVNLKGRADLLEENNDKLRAELAQKQIDQGKERLFEGEQ